MIAGLIVIGVDAAIEEKVELFAATEKTPKRIDPTWWKLADSRLAIPRLMERRDRNVAQRIPDCACRRERGPATIRGMVPKRLKTRRWLLGLLLLAGLAAIGIIEKLVGGWD